MLSENLVKLYNTLAQIETKGENTKTMAMCLSYLEGLVAEERKKEAKCAKEPENSVENEEEQK